MPGMMTSEKTRSAENSSVGKHGERGGGIGHALDPVAEIFQQFGGELSDVVIVLDDQHAIAAAARRRARRGTARLGCGGRRGRACGR